MKFLSATAVFAAALPSITSASSVESQIETKDLNSSRTGSSSSQSFTEIIPENGAEYRVSGDVSFSDFSNIPEEAETLAISHKEQPNNEVVLSEENHQASFQDSAQNQTENASEGNSPNSENTNQSSTTETESITTDEQVQNDNESAASVPTTVETATAMRLPSYHLQTESLVEGATEEDQNQSNSQNTSSGGGAFYNSQQGPLSFINDPDKDSSLTLSKIRVIGEGGAIYSKGPLSITGLKKLALKENLSQKAGGAICAESTISISSVDSIIFSKNTVTPPAANKPELPNDPSGSNGNDGSDDSNSSGNTDSNESNPNNSASNNTGSENELSSSTPSAQLPNPATPFLSSVSTNSQPIDTEPENAWHAESGSGGAIYSKGKLSIASSKEVVFDHNSATKNGGAIFGEEEIALEKIASLKFDSNTTGEKGGAIHAKTVTLSDIKNTLIFVNNTAKTPEENSLKSSQLNNQNPSEEEHQDTSEGEESQSLETSPITNQDSASSHVAIFRSIAASSSQSNSENIPNADGSTSAGGDAGSSSQPSTPGSDSSINHVIGGGAIYGEAVKIENLSGYGTFSNNNAVDHQISGSTSDVLGGAIYAKTSLTIDSGNSSGTITFSENTASSKSTTGQVAGGAIFSPSVTITTPVTFSKNSAINATTSSKKDTFGGAIGAISTVSLSKGARFSENIADLGSAIGLVPTTQDAETVQLTTGSYYFEKNKALKRATVYAPIVSIKAHTATFDQNISAEEGSAIYFTKEATIESLGSVLFTGNLVTPIQSTTVLTSGNTSKYGAAIFGQIANASGSQTDNLPLKLIASGGNISFRNNEYRPDATNTGQSTFCSIAGDIKLTMQAAEGKVISFFDAIRTSTKKTGTLASAYDTLDINKSNDSGSINSAFTGTIMFSSELHENKSYIPQNVVLHSGSLILKANTELHVLSFDQKEGSSLIMEPGSVLSNQDIADGSLVVNSLTIDLSSVGRNSASGDNIFMPPELRIVDTSTNSGNSSSTPPSSNTPPNSTPTAQAPISKNFAATTTTPTTPPTTGNIVFLNGVIKLIDPNGTFFQNPALGSDQKISLLVLPSDQTKLQAQKVVLTGDISPKKGYTGTLTLDPQQLQNGVIQALWTFKSYRQWAYIPRDNHFYANSILGSQMSMATVKQGLINDKLNLARFDEVAYNNLWISGLGTMLSQRGGQRSEEMTYYSRGASVALDAKPTQDLIIGAAFSKMIGRSKSLKLERNYTHKGSEYSYQASVYGGSPFYLTINKEAGRSLPLLLQGVISYGYIKHDTVTHYPTIRELNKGEWEDLGWLTALRVSSILKTPKQGDSKRITVYGEVEYSSIRQKQFTETEYDPRYFSNCTYRNLAVPVGLALEGEFKGNDILMYNRFSVAYMPSIYRNSPVCKYQVLSSGEGGEIVCGVPTRNSSRAEYSTQLYLGPLWTLYGSYTLEADAHTLANMINCGARMTF